MSDPPNYRPLTADEPDQWLSAAETLRLITNAIVSSDVNIAIAQRAHAGLLRAKALLFISGNESLPDAPVPPTFWWADGHEALTQNWQTGDFETWIERKLHLRALGVSFHLGDLRKSFPDTFKVGGPPQNAPEPLVEMTGRPPAEWWEDMWIDICRRLYVGDLQPKRQADIEEAMNSWIAMAGKSAAESTVRRRASRLWRAICHEAEK